MANPDHVAKLKEGVAAWNEWRRQNPDIYVDLSGVDFEKAEWRDTSLWHAEWKRLVFIEREPDGTVPDYSSLFGAKAKAVDLSNANLRNTNLRRAIFWHANFAAANADGCDWSGTHLRSSNLRKAYLTGARLRDVSFRDANLSDGSLHMSDITGADFVYCILTNVWTSGVKYSIRRMKGRYRDIVDLQSTRGSATWRRDAADQEFIDSKTIYWSSPWWNPARLFILAPWGWFDYGRSWARVAMLAAFLIGLFGFGYSVSIGTHIRFEHSGPTVTSGFYPWFAAGMGFATLGITDLIEPLDAWGQALMIGNVLSGFVTLGLLLAVLGNGFARRS